MVPEAADAMPWLIADVGATNSRCAVYDAAARGTRNLAYFHNDDFDSFDTLLARYLSGLAESPDSGAIAVAAPVSGDEVQMINRDWRFDRRDIATKSGFRHLAVINDFHAIAFALPIFDDSSRWEIGSASEYRSGNLAVLGPGSGLGMAAWIVDDENGVAMCGEGGHITLAARDDDEEKLLRFCRASLTHSSAERLLSGPGLKLLHRAMHGIDVDAPEDITGNSGDEKCAATLEQFFRFLGSVAADLALITGAAGGVYIAGGIVPACLDAFGRSSFRERFEDKNRYRDYMRAIPTYVITDPTPGLTGLAAYIGRRIDRA